jgi:hypothetical protein
MTKWIYPIQNVYLCEKKQNEPPIKKNKAISGRRRFTIIGGRSCGSICNTAL